LWEHDAREIARANGNEPAPRAVEAVVRTTGELAGADDAVGRAFDEYAGHRGEKLGRVLEVAVDAERMTTARVGEARAQRTAETTRPSPGAAVQESDW
jgi:hypothetical protein